jgi:long-subunit acyl-CoA synthetase (AMP-forming)
MVKPTWRMVSPIPFFYMHYMPMNHSFGRSGVFSTLGSGGTCYFTAKSDLSMLFEDIRMARPTFMGIVPRICEMVYQHYQVELERRSPGATNLAALEQELLLETRNNVLKLAQGEFVAISRLESLYTNGHPAIRQVYLYGTSERSYLVGVIVPNEDTLREMGITGNDKAIKWALREAIKEVARTEQLNAYEVPRDFIVEHEAFSVDNGLLAGIGKYQRPMFKERYGTRLEKLYDEIAASQTNELQALRLGGRDTPVQDTVARAVRATLGIEELNL